MELAEYLNIEPGVPFSIKNFASQTLFQITPFGILDFYYRKNPSKDDDKMLFQALSHLIKYPDSVDPYYEYLSSVMVEEEFRFLKHLCVNWGVEKVQKVSAEKYYLDNKLVEYNLFPSMPFGYYNLRKVFK